MPILPVHPSFEPPEPACVGVDLDVFFRRDHEAEADWLARQPAAVAVCAGCLIRARCLDDALRFPVAEQHGVQGGLTARQRVALIAARRRAERRAAA